MGEILLQNMIKDLKLENLPSNWIPSGLEEFSKSKKLWKYQQDAIENAIKVLYKYFEDFVDYEDGENIEEKNQRRKEKLYEWYKNNGLKDEDVDIILEDKKSSKKMDREIYNLLREYYPIDNGRISYKHFINRMSFWMATGSGKSILIIKLIQILIHLIRLKEIPKCNILILTHRDDLIQQFKKHVDEFNSSNGLKINLKDLREYTKTDTSEDNIVFYYRSDNISDEKKEKIVDFKDYDDGGKWYIFLDEAHKGDKEDSKRQHIYSILSRNGFLFNFSATFTDPRDIYTCAFEFNLSKFISDGYGKHIYVMKQEIRAFQDKEDYSEEEKQKIVLKSLILLTYVKKTYENIKAIQPDLYHKPLLLTLTNTVNTKKPEKILEENIGNTESAKLKEILKSAEGQEDKVSFLRDQMSRVESKQVGVIEKVINELLSEADLKQFFVQLRKIGKGEIKDEVFKSAIDELWSELGQGPNFIFEEQKVDISENALKNITKEDILRYVYNSESPGEIEVLIRRSNNKELAFKLKTSDKPFALIKIGDISGWLKNELGGYEVQEGFDPGESYFENLNSEDSTINILMGSRSFYEGWDSNRPNVINFINIGVGVDAQKFILQSIGRGVRIEPIKDKRKRLLNLYNAKEVDEDLFNKIKDLVLPMETLFIFGTNRNAINTVIRELDKSKDKKAVKGKEFKLELFENEKVKDDKIKLLVPKYKPADNLLLMSKKLTKFLISQEDFKALKTFLEYVQDDRIFLLRYNTEPIKVKILRDSINEPEKHFKFERASLKNIDIIIQRFFDYISVVEEEYEKLKELEEEIRHFKNIKVYLEDISDFKQKIENVRNFKGDPDALIKDLQEKLKKGEINLDEYTQGIKKIARAVREERVTYENKTLMIKHIANHYYLPLILSDDEKIDFITNIIKTKSEVKFIRDLEKYLSKPDNKFNEFDWWMFSKVYENVDDIYIPYYNPNINKISRFYPDFIFWLRKGNNYFIVFVDPKGTEHTQAERKIDGYKALFEDEYTGQEKVLQYDNLNVKIKLLFRAEDVSKASEQYRKYWFDNIEDMFKNIT